MTDKKVTGKKGNGKGIIMNGASAE